MLITPEYQQALLDIHATAQWGDTAGKYAGDSIVELLKDHPEIETILDYGCGEGTLREWVEDKGIHKDWTLYDPGMWDFKNKPKGKFDLVITTDVLEHVEEIMLNNVIKHLRELTGRFLYNEIACYFCSVRFGSGPYIGQDLHINVKAPDQWGMRLIHPDFNVIKHHVSVIDDWKVRYLLIQERKNSE
jgi:hypothetical protein